MLRATYVAIDRTLQKALVGLITAYRYVLSPLLGHHCRFYPTCSTYSLTAIRRFGTLKGLYLTVRRLLCCHPFHPGGEDLVPTQLKR